VSLCRFEPLLTFITSILFVFISGAGLRPGAGEQALPERQLLADHEPGWQPAHSRLLLQQNVHNDLASGGLADSLRQASVADARSRIRSAVDSGGKREMVAGASQPGHSVPLRRAMLQSATA
jgi:hypothetical protein